MSAFFSSQFTYSHFTVLLSAISQHHVYKSRLSLSHLPHSYTCSGQWTSLLQLSSVALSCPTLCNPMHLRTPGLPVHHQLPEIIQTYVHRVSDAIQPSHPLSSPSPPAPKHSQHQGLFQQVNSSHEVAEVLEFQLQHQSFQ